MIKLLFDSNVVVYNGVLWKSRHIKPDENQSITFDELCNANIISNENNVLFLSNK